MTSSVVIDSILSETIDLLRDRTGFVIPSTRRADVEIAIRKVMLKSEFVDPAKCLEKLHSDEVLLDELISEVTIGETHFFRNPSHFDFIRTVVIPEIRKLRGPTHGLRVWSAGCATGEEPYSLAILLEQEGCHEGPPILATDVSRAALARAREATYGAWSVRDGGRHLINPYLKGMSGRFELAERFRKRVSFAYLNLANDIYPSTADAGAMDLVLCRNVLMYLDSKTVAGIARRLYDSLADGGFLIAGPSDPLLAEHAPYETVTTPGGLIYRKNTQASRRLADFEVPRQSDHSADDNFIFFAENSSEPLIDVALPGVEEPLSEQTSALAEARDALARGENARVVELTVGLMADATAVILRVRAMANLGEVDTAVRVATGAISQHPSSLELHFLLAVLLIGLNRYDDALNCLRRILYLNRSLAVAQFTLGTTLHRLGDFSGAVCAYRNARNLAARRPSEEVLPLADGETAEQLAKAAVSQMAILQSQMGARQ